MVNETENHISTFCSSRCYRSEIFLRRETRAKIIILNSILFLASFSVSSVIFKTSVISSIRRMNNKLTQFKEIDVCKLNTEPRTDHETETSAHLSLAYGQVKEIPKEILLQMSHRIEFLDLSHNQFKDLSFLSEFRELQTLILDRNLQLDYTTFPQLLKLETLWLNNCNLININDWLLKLQVQCPNLKDLSMMCNPVGQTQLNGVTVREEDEYRENVHKILPQLHYFDGISTAVKHSRNVDTKSSPLTNNFYQTLRNIKEFSTNIQKNFKSMDHLNRTTLLLPIVTITAK